MLRTMTRPRMVLLLATLWLALWIALPGLAQQKAPAGAPKCSSNAQCGKKEFCDTFPSCGSAATGSCRKKPEVCPQDRFPAIGCDGKSYPNACRTHAAGVSIRGRN